MSFLGGIGPRFTENVRIEWAEGKAVVRRRERRVECMSWTEGVDPSVDEHHLKAPARSRAGTPVVSLCSTTVPRHGGR